MKTIKALSIICKHCLLVLLLGVMICPVIAKATETDGAVAVGSGIPAVIKVESYTVDGAPLEAGKDVTINLTLTNTSKTSSANMLLVTVSSSTGLIYPAFGYDNQVYVGNLAAGSTETISIPVSISSNYKSQAVDFLCNFTYTSAGRQLTNTSTIVIPSTTGGSVEIDSIYASSRATVNGASLLSLGYTNRTNAKIVDAEILVEGNVSAGSKSIALGTIAAGKSYSKDCQISFNQAGDQEINVTLVYTDLDGEKIETKLGTFTVEVGDEVVVENNAETNMMLFWCGRVIALLALLVAGIVAIRYIIKR